MSLDRKKYPNVMLMNSYINFEDMDNPKKIPDVKTKKLRVIAQIDPMADAYGLNPMTYENPDEPPVPNLADFLLQKRLQRTPNDDLEPTGDDIPEDDIERLDFPLGLETVDLTEQEPTWQQSLKKWFANNQ